MTSLRSITSKQNTGVSRLVAAERLEKIAAILRSGLTDTDDVHARIPDRVELEATVHDGGFSVAVSWGTQGRAASATTCAAGRTGTHDSPADRAEAHEAERVRLADEAVVRDAREGRMP
jgi:hypothetical protein